MAKGEIMEKNNEKITPPSDWICLDCGTTGYLDYYDKLKIREIEKIKKCHNCQGKIMINSDLFLEY